MKIVNGTYLRTAACSLALLMLAGILGACTGNMNIQGNNHNAATLNGELVYRQRIALPPQAVMHVRLADIDSGTVLARHSRATDGKQVPLPFQLKLTDTDSPAGHDYVISATITDKAGRLLWAADVPVENLQDSNKAELRIRLAQTTVDNDALTGTRWQLQRIEYADNTIDWANGSQRSTLEFGADGRVHGKAACNSYFAAYELSSHGNVDIQKGGSTLMACMTPNLARPFLQALGQVDSYVIAGKQLRLRTPNGTVVVLTKPASEA